MKMVYLIASKSKDVRTKIGAIIIDDKQSVLSVGFNGICRGVFDPFDMDSDAVNFQKKLEAFGQINFEKYAHAVELPDRIKKRWERPQKYFWFEHAERNAIYAAARNGVKLDGTTLYTNGIPCADCGRAIIQSGIKKVVIHKEWPMSGVETLKVNKGWEESIVATREMFLEADVEIKVFEGVLGVKGMCDGKEVEV